MRPDIEALQARLDDGEWFLRHAEVKDLLTYIAELEGQRDTALVEQVNQLNGQIERATAVLDKIRYLAYMGGQPDEAVRRWILAEFGKAGWRDYVTLNDEEAKEE